MDAAQVKEALKNFDIPGVFARAAPHGGGHINDTFAVSYLVGGLEAKYIAQRLNGKIFGDPVGVMENIAHVIGHLRGKAVERGQTDIDRRFLTLVKALDGRDYAFDGDGGLWRCYVLIGGARTWDILKSPRQAYEVAKAFGAFQRDLMDYEGPRLFETIPMFHHTPRRFAALEGAIQADTKNRAASAKAEIDFALSGKGLADRLVSLQEGGSLPERITHNDTKINNVLLDDATGEGVCVLDLDTVMPGLSLYDFGDLVRSATNPVAEDERDVSKVVVQAPIFGALAGGYLEGLAGALLPIERENLVTAGMLLAFECGIRFLTDFLQGDVYFKTARPGHNLDRCRTQFALLRSLEEREEALTALIPR